jgi:putative ABC transport system permease protein
MRIPLLEGRDFSERDTEHQPLVAIVSESTARHFWPGGNAVGKRIQLGGGSEPWIEIVGVVKDVRWHEFDNEVVTKLYAYVPCAQDPYRTMSVVLRTAGAPEALADSIRKVVHEIDQDQSISHLRSMNEVVTWANAPRRFNMVLMGAFAVFALFLTAAGVYGTVTHSVSSRKREFGVHLALGATPAMILRMLLGEGMRLALVGAVTGLISALLLGRTVASLLYGVSPNDPLTMAGSFILLLLVAAIASGIPGLRAMRLDPGKILREE